MIRLGGGCGTDGDGASGSSVEAGDFEREDGEAGRVAWSGQPE